MKEEVIDIDERGRVLSVKPTTPTIGLVKPTATDFYNIDDQNTNMDILDGEIKKSNEQIQNCFEQIQAIDISWPNIPGKPPAYPPEDHDHDTDYLRIGANPVRFANDDYLGYDDTVNKFYRQSDGSETKHYMYDTGNKPTPSEIGAAPISHNHNGQTFENMILDKYVAFGDDDGVTKKTFLRDGVWHTEFTDIACGAHHVYHGGRKPTKTDVGLGNVPNYSASSSVSSSSNTTFATSGAVKTAYDKANHPHPYSPLSHATSTSNPHNVTKAQVGLGNVPNKADSNSVNGTSSTLANSEAVKTAYNKGVEALNKANQAINEAGKIKPSGYSKIGTTKIPDTTAANTVVFSTTSSMDILAISWCQVNSGHIQIINGGRTYNLQYYVGGDWVICPPMGDGRFNSNMSLPLSLTGSTSIKLIKNGAEDCYITWGIK